MTKYPLTVAFLGILLLSGCVNLYAGIARYDVRPFYDPVAKQFVCCSATVTSGKNAGSVVAHIVKSGENFTVDLTESAVDASSSIAAAAIAASDVSAAVTSAAVTAAKFAPK